MNPTDPSELSAAPEQPSAFQPPQKNPNGDHSLSQKHTGSPQVALPAESAPAVNQVSVSPQPVPNLQSQPAPPTPESTMPQPMQQPAVSAIPETLPAQPPQSPVIGAFAPAPGVTLPKQGMSANQKMVIGIVAVFLLVFVPTIIAVSVLMSSDDKKTSSEAKPKKETTAQYKEAPHQEQATTDSQATNGDPFSSESDTTTTSTYPADIKIAAINECVSSGGTQTACTCVMNYFEQNVSYQRFVQLDEQMRNSTASEMPKEVFDSAHACQHSIY